MLKEIIITSTHTHTENVLCVVCCYKICPNIYWSYPVQI